MEVVEIQVTALLTPRPAMKPTTIPPIFMTLPVQSSLFQVPNLSKPHVKIILFIPVESLLIVIISITPTQIPPTTAPTQAPTQSPTSAPTQAPTQVSPTSTPTQHHRFLQLQL
eukprot:TRINITY_DN1027_c0_g4_i2.p1 TRINITY_DN1027_c0_g4~~TRINITY_DN1027_c0_g4_i2.p1  ORF type:complete len:113 (-),score=14.54 TRINITY_DN1027_c0_g4_i2:162-500(-)